MRANMRAWAVAVALVGLCSLSCKDKELEAKLAASEAIAPRSKPSAVGNAAKDLGF